MAELSSLRDKMRAMVQDAARKETALAQLKAQVEKMNKDINRYIYFVHLFVDALPPHPVQQPPFSYTHNVVCNYCCS